MNDKDIQAKDKLKTFGEFWIKGVQFVLTEPAIGDILTFTAIDKVENTTDPSLNPYTSFTFNEGGDGKIRTYKDATVIETFDLPSVFVTATSLATILSGYLTTNANKETFQLTLNIGNGEDVATRISGLIEGTDYPSGWSLSAGIDPKDLIVTHGTGRNCKSAFVWTIESDDSLNQRDNGLDFINLVQPNANSVKLVGLAQVSKKLRIYISLV